MPYEFEILEDDTDDEFLMELFLESTRRKRRKKLIRSRPDLLNEYDDEEFHDRFRLSKETVLEIYYLIRDQVEHRTDRNNAVTAINQLLLTLRFFACGDLMIALGDFGGIHKSTICRIIHRVSRAIASLGPAYIALPRTEEEIKTTQDAFYKVAKFPRVIGVLDCTHIKIKNPGSLQVEYYRGRKNYYSVNVQTVCDTNLKIRDIVATWPGATNEQTIFDSSALKAQMELGRLGDGVLLGDSGYAVTNYLLTPMGNPDTAADYLYNESHIRTRNLIERCYGVWKRRFPVLTLGIRLTTGRIEAVIVACAVLHNIAIEKNEPMTEPLRPDIERIMEEDFAHDAEERRRQIDDGGNKEMRNIFVQHFDNLLQRRNR